MKPKKVNVDVAMLDAAFQIKGLEARVKELEEKLAFNFASLCTLSNKVEALEKRPNPPPMQSMWDSFFGKDTP